jgi:molybdopterin-guanine dinucleotide biosynthesis protein A
MLEGETLAERAYRLLGEVCDEVIAVGKAADRLPLPFPVLDDGDETRAAIVGVAAGLRRASSEISVVFPTDMPWVTPGLLRKLVDAAEGVDVAVPQTGPLPGAYRRRVLPALERRIAAGDLGLHRALAELTTGVVEWDVAELGNVNTPADLG